MHHDIRRPSLADHRHNNSVGQMQVTISASNNSCRNADGCPAICVRSDSSPVEVTLLVDLGKVYTQALLIARHGDFQHPGGGVQPLRGPLDPGDSLIVGNQVT